jgi:hypothetical protein
MTSKSANVSTVTLADGRMVCLSYGVIVAAFIPQSHLVDFAKPVPADDVRNLDLAGFVGGYVRTDKRYSVTTSKHMNQFAGKGSPIVPDATLQALCYPLQSRR